MSTALWNKHKFAYKTHEYQIDSAIHDSNETRNRFAENVTRKKKIGKFGVEKFAPFGVCVLGLGYAYNAIAARVHLSEHAYWHWTTQTEMCCNWHVRTTDQNGEKKTHQTPKTRQRRQWFGKKVYSIYGIKWCVEFWILDHLMHRKEVVSIQTFLNQCHEPPKSSRLHRFRVAHSRNLSAHMFIILNNFAFAKNYLGIKIENKFYAIIKWLCPTFFFVCHLLLDVSVWRCCRSCVCVRFFFHLLAVYSIVPRESSIRLGFFPNPTRRILNMSNIVYLCYSQIHKVYKFVNL